MEAIGQLPTATVKDEAVPTLPGIFVGVWDKYRNLKFIQRNTADSLVLCPRDMLNWQDLVAYKSMTGETISLLETELIMGIDAIFEGREDG